MTSTFGSKRKVISCNHGSIRWSRGLCEAVGNFLIYQLSKNYNKKDIGLYRNDGLAIFKNVIGFKAEKIKKDMQKLFKDNHLNITIQYNLKIVNYLDVTFNLSNATYRPFCKTNNEIAYCIYLKNQTTHHLF